MKESKLKNKVDELETNEAFVKVMHWFFSYPLMPISLSELAKEIEISKKTANKIVLALIEEGFLIKEEIGKAWRIHCNQKHWYNSTNKISYNLLLVYNLLYRSRLIEKIYKETGSPRAIILFGSYRKGDDTEKSDIDLAVEVIGNNDMQIIDLGTVEQLGYRKNVRINLHVFSRNKINLNLFSNISNGIVIEGFMEVRP